MTLVEYGDLECPFCGQAEPVVRELLADVGRPPLRLAPPAAERRAPARPDRRRGDRGGRRRRAGSGRCTTCSSSHQDALTPADLIGYARELGLDVDRFTEDLRRHAYASRIAEDVDGADLSNVSGTPTFFVNGLRHQGAYDLETLKGAVQIARARAALAA